MGGHLEPVPEEGGALYQAVAQEADAAVREAMEKLRGLHHRQGGAVLVGAVAAIARDQLQAMPIGTPAFQVAQKIAPLVLQMAMKVVGARNDALAEQRPGGDAA